MVHTYKTIYKEVFVDIVHYQVVVGLPNPDGKHFKYVVLKEDENYIFVYSNYEFGKITQSVNCENIVLEYQKITGKQLPCIGGGQMRVKDNAVFVYGDSTVVGRVPSVILERLSSALIKTFQAPVEIM